MKEIRQYIIEVGMWKPHYQSLSPDFEDSADVFRASTEIAGQVISMATNTVAAEREYRSRILDVQRDYMDYSSENYMNNTLDFVLMKYAEEHDNKLPNSNQIQAIKSQLKTKEINRLNSLTPAQMNQELLKNRKADMEIIGLQRKYQKLDLATRGISAARATFEDLASIADIVKRKSDKRKLEKKKISDAANILNQVNDIKNQGAIALANLDKEMRSLKESMIGGMFKKIVDVFKKLFSRTRSLKRQAKKL